MKRCIIQYIVGRRPSGVDECDLDWRTINGESYAESDIDHAWEMAETYDSDFDHRMTHRVIVVDVEPEALKAKPPVKTAPAAPVVKPAARMKAARLEGSPKPAASAVNRQLTEHRAKERFTRNSEKLRVALAAGVAFDFLLPIVELLEIDVDHCGSTVLAARFREQLADLRKLVDAAQGKPTLRVVK